MRQDIKTDALEKMTTKDALVFYKAISEKFKDADTVFTNNTISYSDKVNTQNFLVELTLQVFEAKKESRYIAKLSRGANWECSNGVRFTEVSKEEFNLELIIQKRFNQIY